MKKISISEIGRGKRCKNLKYKSNDSILGQGIYYHNLIEKGLKGQFDKLTEEEANWFNDNILEESDRFGLITGADWLIEKWFDGFIIDDYEFRGKIDLIQILNKSALLIDWKCGQGLPQPGQLQDILYALHILIEYNIDVVQVKYFNPVTKQISNSVNYKIEDVEVLLDRVRQELKQYEKSMSGDVRPGDDCSRCVNLFSCALKQYMADLGTEDLTLDTIMATADLYSAAAKEWKKLAENLIIEAPDDDLSSSELFNVSRKKEVELKVSWSKKATEYWAENFKATIKPDTSAIKKILLADNEAQKAAIRAGAAKIELKDSISWKRKK